MDEEPAALMRETRWGSSRVLLTFSVWCPQAAPAPSAHVRPSAPAHGPASGPAARGGATAGAHLAVAAAPLAPAPLPGRPAAPAHGRAHEGKAGAPGTRGMLWNVRHPSLPYNPLLGPQLLPLPRAVSPAHSSPWMLRCPNCKGGRKSRRCGSFSTRTRANGVRPEASLGQAGVSQGFPWAAASTCPGWRREPPWASEQELTWVWRSGAADGQLPTSSPHTSPHTHPLSSVHRRCCQQGGEAEAGGGDPKETAGGSGDGSPPQ